MISTYRNARATAMILCASLFVGHAYGTPADGSPARATRVTAPSASTVQQPSPEMQSLTKAIAGRWSTEITYGPESASSPKKVSHGEQVWRSGPGGYTLLEEERIGTSSGEQFLLALHWWDNEAKQFKGLLCNNSGTGACDVDTFYNSSLVWDGQTLSIDLNFTQAGKKMLWHEVFQDFTSTSFTQTGDMGEAGGALTRVLVIHVTRVGRALAKPRFSGRTPS